MGAPSLAVNWREVRAACEGGLTFAAASEVFGISVDSIKQRSCRELWTTLPRLNKAQAALAASSPNRHQTPSTVSLIAQTLQERQQLHTETLYRITKKAWKQVEKAPPLVQTVGDLEKLDKVTRLNLGMVTNDAAPAVQVLFSGQDSLRAAVVSDSVVQEIENTAEEYQDVEI